MHIKRDNSVKVIIPVHYGGEPVNLKNLWDLAEKYGLFILEDAAHALETNFQGEKLVIQTMRRHSHSMLIRI